MRVVVAAKLSGYRAIEPSAWLSRGRFLMLRFDYFAELGIFMPRRAALRFAISTFLLSTVWQPVAAGIVDPLMWKNTPSLDGAVQAPAFQARLNSDILAERLRSRSDLGGIEALAE